MVDRDYVELLGLGESYPVLATFGDRHPVAAARERARSETPDARIVVDVEDAGTVLAHQRLGLNFGHLDHGEEQP